MRPLGWKAAVGGHLTPAHYVFEITEALDADPFVVSALLVVRRRRVALMDNVVAFDTRLSLVAGNTVVVLPTRSIREIGLLMNLRSRKRGHIFRFSKRQSSAIGGV